MIIRSYKETREFKKYRGDKEVNYTRDRSMYDIKCDACGALFSRCMDVNRTINGKKHLCNDCRLNNKTGELRKQHRKEKEDRSLIGTRRMMGKHDKYPVVYAGIDSWHGGEWIREHICYGRASRTSNFNWLCSTSYRWR